MAISIETSFDDGVSYFLNTNPSSLNIYQNTEVLQTASVNLSTYQDGLEIEGHDYRLNFICTTSNYGFDVFEVVNDEINLSSSSAYSGSIEVKVKSLQNTPNGTYNGFLDITLSKRKTFSNDPWSICSAQRVALTLSVALPTSYNFSTNKNSDTIQFIRNTGTSNSTSVAITSDTTYEVTGPSFIRANGNPLPLSLSGNKTILFTTVDSNELVYGINQKVIAFKKANLHLGNFLLDILLTNTNQLEVSTHQLNYSILSSNKNSSIQEITVHSPTAIPSITKPSWLIVEQKSKKGNVYQYNVKVSAIELLDGTYSDVLSFSDGTHQEEISIHLEIYGYWNQTYNKEIHFSLDDEKLLFHPFQRNENNFINIILTGVVNNNLQEQLAINESLNFYFSTTNTTFNLGKYMHDYFLMYENQINDLDVTSSSIQHKKMYEPARIDLTITEKNYTTQESVYWYSIPTQLFIKGHRPKTLTTENLGFLANYVNKTLRATCNGKTILNYIHNRQNVVKVYVNGNPQGIEIPTIINSKLSVFSLYIDFSILELKVGDLVEFQIGTQVIRYVIFPDTNESNFIAYIDYWGLLKLFEVTGEYRFPMKGNYVNYSPKKGHLKNVDFTRNNTLNINTGNITEDDCQVITEILSSPKCWFIQGTEITEIIPTTEEVELFDSTNELFSYELEFHINPTSYDNNYGRK